ncbi:MAG: T9SS type A sorting domain-containing protein [Bacteroidota bacterium]
MKHYLLLVLSLILFPSLGVAQFWEFHWIDGNINFTGSGGDALTVTQTECEEGLVVVTNPVDAPLAAFSPIIINPKDANEDDITDISAFTLQFTIRARSTAQVEVSALFRSDDGTSDFRTNRVSGIIPAGLDNWTELTLEINANDIAGFNADNLRDFWFYMDRGTENFAGNEFYIDYIALGGAPTPGLESPCQLGESSNDPDTLIFAEYFQGDSLKSINTGSTAGSVTTFTLDTLCETLQLSVSDPNNAPLPNFNAYIVNPVDAEGNDITDIVGNVNVQMRVRSLAAVNVDLLFRSGGGTSEERTDRKSVNVPAGLDQWTSFNVEFTESDLAGFDPSDLRDLWFYLDRGTPNFAGNEFYIDYILIGGTPDSSRFSPCSTEIQAQTWLENWETMESSLLGGAETEKLTLTQTECEELKIEVTDPLENPHQSFRPIVINPLNTTGSALSNISGNVQVVLRVRSAGEVPIGILFRSGDGSADFRTAILTQNVSANLEAWTTLVYTFTEEDIGGFNPEDLVDLWIFLDRDNNNFSGNEIYFDYITIGEQPDSTINSPCGLPELVVGTNTIELVSFFEVYPNPVRDQLQIQLDARLSLDTSKELTLYDAYGRLLLRQGIPRLQEQVVLDVSGVPVGLLYLQIDNGPYQFTKKIMKLGN